MNFFTLTFRALGRKIGKLQAPEPLHRQGRTLSQVRSDAWSEDRYGQKKKAAESSNPCPRELVPAQAPVASPFPPRP
jgi:hypothetical protein